jgi:type IV pilus assembly protein PilM
MGLGLYQTGQFALDIGGSSVFVVSVAGKPESLKLRACYDWPLTPGMVADGEIIEPELFVRELKTYVNRYKLKGRAVHLSVSNQKVIVRNIDMPDLAEEELKNAVQLQAHEYIPIPVDEVVLDSQVIGRHVAADGTARQEVLLVAAQKTMIMNLLTSVRRAGLKVLGIDVSSLALARALVPDSPFLPTPGVDSSCYGLVDVSSSVTTLAVVMDGGLRFTRIINFSSDRFPRALSEGLGIPFEDGQALMRHIGLPGPLSPDRSVYRDEVVDEVQTSLGGVTNELTEEIRRSLDFHQAQERSVPVQQLILSGCGALVRNLDTHLATSLSLPVSLANPLTHVADNSSGMSDADLAAMSPCLSVALGLVLPEKS